MADVSKDGAKGELQQLKQELSKADSGISRMYDALENGMVTADEMFRDRIQALKARREQTLNLIGRVDKTMPYLDPTSPLPGLTSSRASCVRGC